MVQSITKNNKEVRAKFHNSSHQFTGSSKVKVTPENVREPLELFRMDFS